MSTALYSDYCAPGALAAVTGCSREWAAAKLRSVSERNGWRIDPVYTDTPALATALREAGYELEDWSVAPGGWRRGRVTLATREEIGQILTAVAAVNEAHPPFTPTFTNDTKGRWTRREFERRMREARATQAEREWRHHRPSLNVAQWLARFPIATWILTVHQHVLVAGDGELIAGGDDGRWNFSTLREAWRVLLNSEGAIR